MAMSRTIAKRSLQAASPFRSLATTTRSTPRIVAPHSASSSTLLLSDVWRLDTPSVGTNHVLASSNNYSQIRGKTQLRWFSDKADVKSEEKAEKSETDSESDEETASDEATKEEPSREEELEALVKDLKDQVLRSLAEQDNTRRIAKQDVESARQFAIKSFAKSLLDVSDNLSRAMEAVPDSAKDKEEENPVLHNLYEGIVMTENGLLKAFESNGLVKFGNVGDEFDPNKHNALFEYPSEDPKTQVPGSVGQIIKAGFMLNDRVLRPAEVGVIKKE